MRKILHFSNQNKLAHCVIISSGSLKFSLTHKSEFYEEITIQENRKKKS